jgi:hypothetical protein
MNILSIVRRIGSLPAIKRQMLPALVKGMALLEGLERTDRRRRRRRRRPPPKE